MSKGYHGGCGRPPKHSQFEAGQFGNPKGRPKRPKEKLDDAKIFRRIALEPIKIATGSSVTSCSEPLFLQLPSMALYGNSEAMNLLERLRRLFPAAEAEPRVISGFE